MLGLYTGTCVSAAAVTLLLRLDSESTAVLLPFDCYLTALRPFDDLRYDVSEGTSIFSWQWTFQSV